MTLELTAEEQAALQLQVDAGDYLSVEDAARSALRKTVDDYHAWLSYARAAVAEGLDEIASGRGIDGETFLQQLRAMKQDAA